MSTSHHIFSQESQSPTAQNQAKLLYITCAQYSQEWNCTIHTHSCTELFFVTAGLGRFQLQHESFSVAVSDLVLVNAGVPSHRAEPGGQPHGIYGTGRRGPGSTGQHGGAMPCPTSPPAGKS